jgi:hypothetical protein
MTIAIIKTGTRVKVVNEYFRSEASIYLGMIGTISSEDIYGDSSCPKQQVCFEDHGRVLVPQPMILILKEEV